MLSHHAPEGVPHQPRGILHSSSHLGVTAGAEHHKPKNRKPSFNLDSLTFIERWPSDKFPPIREIVLTRPSLAASYGFQLTKQDGFGQVADVAPGSVADEAGLKTDQWVVGINGQILTNETTHEELVQLVLEKADSARLLIAEQSTFDYYQKNNFVFSYDYAISEEQESPVRRPEGKSHLVTVFPVTESTITKFRFAEELQFGFSLAIESLSQNLVSGNHFESRPEKLAGYSWCIQLMKTCSSSVRLTFMGRRDAASHPTSPIGGKVGDRFVPVIHISVLVPASERTAEDAGKLVLDRKQVLGTFNEEKSDTYSCKSDYLISYSDTVDVELLPKPHFQITKTVGARMAPVVKDSIHCSIVVNDQDRPDSDRVKQNSHPRYVEV